MEKVNLVDQFAKRLRLALINAEYGSSKSSSGVNISKFAQMTGYSAQICRKYLRGEAIPEPSKLAEIAQKLKVSPGWLLFGDSHTNNANEENKITINKIYYTIFLLMQTLYMMKRITKKMCYLHSCLN